MEFILEREIERVYSGEGVEKETTNNKHLRKNL
jgi:hypothetical protein